MEVVKIGDRDEKFIGYPDGSQFDFTDNGAMLRLYYNKPTQQEIDAVQNGKLKFSMFTKEEMIYLLIKFEGLHWMDAAYHRSLSIHLNNELQDVADGEGYAMMISMIDTSNGELKVMRFISLSTNFSRKLKKNIEIQKQNPITKEENDRRVRNAFTQYSTKDMVKYSEARCLIK